MCFIVHKPCRVCPDGVLYRLEGNSTNYRRLIGADAKLESMESDVEKATMLSLRRLSIHKPADK